MKTITQLGKIINQLINMKINYVLMGSNNNPLYLDFWPIVSKVWKIFFNITPVLGLITNEKEEIIY